MPDKRATHMGIKTEFDKGGDRSGPDYNRDLFWMEGVGIWKKCGVDLCVCLGSLRVVGKS